MQIPCSCNAPGFQLLLPLRYVCLLHAQASPFLLLLLEKASVPGVRVAAVIPCSCACTPSPLPHPYLHHPSSSFFSECKESAVPCGLPRAVQTSLDTQRRDTVQCGGERERSGYQERRSLRWWKRSSRRIWKPREFSLPCSVSLQGAPGLCFLHQGPCNLDQGIPLLLPLKDSKEIRSLVSPSSERGSGLWSQIYHRFPVQCWPSHCLSPSFSFPIVKWRLEGDAEESVSEGWLRSS